MPVGTPPGAAIHLQVAHTPTVTIRQPDGSLVVRAGKPVILAGDDEIGTLAAAKILGIARNTLYSYLDQGLLREGDDWRQLAEGRKFFIKRASVIRLSGRMKMEDMP